MILIPASFRYYIAYLEGKKDFELDPKLFDYLGHSNINDYPLGLWKACLLDEIKRIPKRSNDINSIVTYNNFALYGSHKDKYMFAHKIIYLRSGIIDLEYVTRVCHLIEMGHQLILPNNLEWKQQLRTIEHRIEQDYYNNYTALLLICSRIMTVEEMQLAITIVIEHLEETSTYYVMSDEGLPCATISSREFIDYCSDRQPRLRDICNRYIKMLDRKGLLFGENIYCIMLHLLCKKRSDRYLYLPSDYMSTILLTSADYHNSIAYVSNTGNITVEDINDFYFTSPLVA